MWANRLFVQFNLVFYSDRKVEPVCSSLENLVLDCYQENQRKSLKCSQMVRAYVKCVEQARKVLHKDLFIYGLKCSYECGTVIYVHSLAGLQFSEPTLPLVLAVGSVG